MDGWKNHFYMVGSEIRRQGKCGAIGNILPGEMCQNQIKKMQGMAIKDIVKMVEPFLHNW